MSDIASLGISIDSRGASDGAQVVVRHLDDIRASAGRLDGQLRTIETSISVIANGLSRIPNGFDRLLDEIRVLAKQFADSSTKIDAFNKSLAQVNKTIAKLGENAQTQLGKMKESANSTKVRFGEIGRKITEILEDKLQPLLQVANNHIGLLAAGFATLYAAKGAGKFIGSIGKMSGAVIGLANRLPDMIAYQLVLANMVGASGKAAKAMAILEVTGIMRIWRGLKNLKGAITTVGSAFIFLGQIAWANPIVLAIGAIAVVIAGLATIIYQNWDVLSDWGGHFVTLGDVVTSVIEEMSDRVAYWTDLFKVDVKLLVAAVRYQFALMGDFFGTVFKRMAKWIDAFKNHFHDVTTHIGKIWDAFVAQVFSKAWELVNQTTAFKGQLRSTKSFWQAFVDIGKNRLTYLVISAIDYILSWPFDSVHQFRAERNWGLAKV